MAAVGAVALASGGNDGRTAADGPTAVPAPGGGWYTALSRARVGRSPTPSGTTRSLIVRGRSLGVTHPSLPCGAKIYIEYNGTRLLTEVIDGKLKQPGRQFELTESCRPSASASTGRSRSAGALQHLSLEFPFPLDPVRGLARKREPTLT